jgi:hypothetical protein
MDEECAICFEKYNRNKIILLCSHKFCKQCLEAWSIKSNTCPMCRIDINQPLIYKKEESLFNKFLKYINCRN